MVYQRIKDFLQGKAYFLDGRSPQWPKIRKAFLAKNPTCSVCGSRNNLEAHHILPFHLAPALELKIDNLIALCECQKHGVNCHLWFGHLGNYRDFNPDVVIDTSTWKTKLNGGN